MASAGGMAGKGGGMSTLPSDLFASFYASALQPEEGMHLPMPGEASPPSAHSHHLHGEAGPRGSLNCSFITQS